MRTNACRARSPASMPRLPPSARPRPDKPPLGHAKRGHDRGCAPVHRAAVPERGDSRPCGTQWLRVRRSHRATPVRGLRRRAPALRHCRRGSPAPLAWRRARRPEGNRDRLGRSSRKRSGPDRRGPSAWRTSLANTAAPSLPAASRLPIRATAARHASDLRSSRPHRGPQLSAAMLPIPSAPAPVQRKDVRTPLGNPVAGSGPDRGSAALPDDREASPASPGVSRSHPCSLPAKEAYRRPAGRRRTGGVSATGPPRLPLLAGKRRPVSLSLSPVA